MARSEYFWNILEDNSNRVPTRREIKDIWFIMDYFVNYAHLKTRVDQHPIKLHLMHRFFISMCDRTHKNNALGNLYFSLLEIKMKNFKEAQRRLELAREYSVTSEYWRKRFPVMHLDSVMHKLAGEITGGTS